MKRILTSFAFVAASLAFAQVSIASSEVTPKATLDIEAIGGSTPDGILIPRVTTAVAQSMPQPETSTLVYIKANQITVGGGDRTTDVDSEGFYYFKDNKWNKLGGGAVAAEPANLNGIKGKIQTIATPVEASEINNDTFAVIVTGASTTTLELPDPSGVNNGRVLGVNNQGGSVLTFTGNYQPANTNGIESGGGFFLISNGAAWFLIGGLGL